MTYAHFAAATFANMLGTLDHLAGEAQAAGLGDEVLSARLTEDMFPLELQFRVAINQVLLALNQVGGRDAPLETETYGSLAEIKARIAAVRAVLNEVGPETWAPAEATVDLTLPNGVRFVMTAEEYVRDWIKPNFYFHVTMVYALLRDAGVEIGKMDFIPHMARHKTADSA
jgi:hypothetical protein